jgi:hypothetical protein
MNEAEKEKFKWPSFWRTVFAILIGLFSSRVTFTPVLGVYLAGAFVFVGLPVYALFNNDKEARERTKSLVEGLEKPCSISQ